MPRSKGITILLFEAPLTPGFRLTDGFLPETSLDPWLTTFALHSGYRLIARSIRFPEDLLCWTDWLKGAPLGTKIIWFATHGEASVAKKGEVDLWCPSFRRHRKGSHINPKMIRNALAKAGALNGVIVDACGFAANRFKTWLPNNAIWALAFTEDVNWLNSMFFSMKVLEWLFEAPQKPPATGEEALHRYRLGLSCDRSHSPRVGFKELAQGIGARFYYRDRGWHEY